jgi:NADH-quinone oxidoreductase subunit L
LATAAFLVGAAIAWLLYSGKKSDPISIPMFANRFYIDEAYGTLIRWTQDLLASFSAWFDRWILDGGAVRGSAGTVWGLGFVLRFFQIGNLQAYAFLFGLGIVGLIYFVLTR